MFHGQFVVVVSSAVTSPVEKCSSVDILGVVCVHVFYSIWEDMETKIVTILVYYHLTVQLCYFLIFLLAVNSTVIRIFKTLSTIFIFVTYCQKFVLHTVMNTAG